MLRRFAKRQAEGSYLHNLLTPAFLKWFELQMRDDFSCDIMGALSAAEATARKVPGLQMQLAALQDRCNNLQERVKRMETEHQQLAEELLQAETAYGRAEAERDRLAQGLRSINNALALVK